MFGRDKVSYGILSLTLFMFLLALMVNATPVTSLDGVAHQPTQTVLEPEMRRMSVAGIPHDPIFIDGDADFTAAALAEGWPGDGSPEAPYIIDGLDINLGSEVGDCISISNTRVYFIISNCYLTGATVDFGSGIYLDNVNNAILDHNTCTGNINGIHIESSHYNAAANNTCTSNARFAIVLYRSNENILANNTCTDNIDGISFNHGILNTAANNTCTSNTYGIFFNNAGLNKAVNNTFNDNEYGLTLHASSSNNINWNVFADNTINARDVPGNTFEYNFWSDYTGTDADGDGIGDTAYTIGYTSDPYPLMFLPTGLIWTEAPVDQTIEIGTHFTYDLNAIAYTPIFWSVNDTAQFTIDSQGMLESIGILSLGNYGVRVTVSNIYGVSLSASFTVEVLFVIDGDASFAVAAQAEGWPGDGSAGNPYVIDGLDIDLGGADGYCISISNTRVNFTIRNCHLTGASVDSGAGIYLEHVMHGKLLSNIFDSNYYGIYLYESSSIIVANNTCTSNTHRGIYLRYSDSNIVANNTCANNGVGICLSGSDSNTVTNNICTNNDAGIYLSNSDSNAVTNNTFTNNGIGIILLHSSVLNTITSNNCSSNTDYGIVIDGGADSNDIHWNIFADNSLNGRNTGSNSFDYNFWSDYAGTDANNDGIGDTPYSGSGFSDPCPLMYLPTPPRWIEPPVDQTVEFEHLFHYELNILCFGPLVCSVSDTAHFNIDNRGVVESTGILPISSYDLRVNVANIYGFSITAIFRVRVVVDASNPPGLLTIPSDQSLAFGEKFEYQITAIDPSGIDHWALNDMTHFSLSTSFFAGGSTASITNNSVLEPGSYGLMITVYDTYGNFLSAAFEVIVMPPEQDTPLLHRPELELSGSFDFLLKEEIHLQLAALLTYLDTGEPISGATVTFDIYDPDGLILVSGTLVEDPADSGVYIYVTPETMKDLKLPKGIYLVYAHASLPDGAVAVDMIQFHIDPPGEDDTALEADLNVPFILATGMILSGVATVGLLVALRRRIGRIGH